MRDGLEVLREQMSLAEIMRLIEKTAMWVSRETFQYLPVWFPEMARRDLMYKQNWSAPQLNTNRASGESVHKQVANESANKALTWALGMKTKERPNWTCCHIWGVDDPYFQRSNSLVADKRFFSCVGNMVLLPTPLKAFTDAMPEVKAMIRIAAEDYYQWAPQHDDVASTNYRRERCDWEAFPESWRGVSSINVLPNVVPFNGGIKRKADARLTRVLSDVQSAGQFYPTESVKEVLRYWSECIPGFGARVNAIGL